MEWLVLGKTEDGGRYKQGSVYGKTSLSPSAVEWNKIGFIKEFLPAVQSPDLRIAELNLKILLLAEVLGVDPHQPNMETLLELCIAKAKEKR